jgi:hypothetical protein
MVSYCFYRKAILILVVVCSSSSKTPVLPCSALHHPPLITALMTQFKICPTMLHTQMVVTTTLPPRVEEVCLHKNHLTLMVSTNDKITLFLFGREYAFAHIHNSKSLLTF